MGTTKEFAELYPDEKIPVCAHGPFLPFQLKTQPQKPIYCCSFDRKIQSTSEKKCKCVVKRKQTCSHKAVETLDENTRFSFCAKCNKLYPSKHGKFTRTEVKQPLKNEIIKPVTVDQNAGQYLLSDRSLRFLASQFVTKFDTILCIGTPRFHAFHPDKFHLYNMFNCTFFDVDGAILKDCPLQLGKETLIITDPPYGGMAATFYDSLDKLFGYFPHVNFKLAWIFPYFNEKDICSGRLPNMKRLDYVVDYSNHPRFQAPLSGRFASATRIFTNVNRKEIEIKDKLNEFCKKCGIYVLKGAKHCDDCDACFGSEGMLGKFKHCHICECCVKAKWTHCEKCDRCRPDYHKFCA